MIRFYTKATFDLYKRKEKKVLETSKASVLYVSERERDTHMALRNCLYNLSHVFLISLIPVMNPICFN